MIVKPQKEGKTRASQMLRETDGGQKQVEERGIREWGWRKRRLNTKN